MASIIRELTTDPVAWGAISALGAGAYLFFKWVHGD